MITSTRDGTIPRPQLLKELNLKGGTAFEILRSMREKKWIEMKRITIKNMYTIKLTEMGRVEYSSRLQKRESEYQKHI